MKDGFESRLTVVLQKALNENGVNPHGGELARIVDSVSKFVSDETGVVVKQESDKIHAQITADAKAKVEADAKAKAEAEAKSKPEAPAPAPKP